MQSYSKENLLKSIEEYNYFIVDGKVLKLHGWLSSFMEDKVCFVLDKEPEEYKSLDAYGEAIDFFLKKEISRGDELIVIGGGATSDFGGFVAATILRGVNWHVVPTTFLSMIDASIGGKVGINSEYGKNLIGAFHLPKTTKICLSFLKTLDQKDYNSGLGELIKYFFISGEINLYKDYDKEDYIKDCAKFKNDIVANDFKENGLRAILNFGHTFGHAIEKINNLPHGVAVYYGIQMLIDFIQPELKSDFKNLSNTLNINFKKNEKMNFDEFWLFLLKDKKRKGDSLDFILSDQMQGAKIINFKLDNLKKLIKENENYCHYFL